MPKRRTTVPILALLPLLAAGCHKLGPDQPVFHVVTLTGMAVAPADQVAGVMPAGPASLLARRGSEADVPLAYARVQALDAALRPVPGVSEARTDGAGRYSLDVPAGRPYVLRFSVGEEEKHLDLMALTRTRTEHGTQVVNADAASHVATQVILERSGGLDSALGALGAPELQGVVDFMRQAIAGKVPSLASPKEVGAVAAAERTARELEPVLARLDAAKEAAAIEEERLITARAVAATAAKTAPVPVAAVPSPTPAPTAAPLPAADTYKVDPPSQEAVAPPQAPVVTRPAVTIRRRALPEADPWVTARQRAYVDAESLLASLPPQVPMVGGGREAPQAIGDGPTSGGQAPRQTASGKVNRQAAGVIRALRAAGSIQALRVAGKNQALRAAGKDLRREGVQAGSHAPRTRLFPGEAPPAVVGSAYASARPDAFGKPRSGPFGLVLEALARWLPIFLPPTGALR